MIDAVVAGHLCLDLIPDLMQDSATDLSELLRPGRLVEAGPMTIATGGAVSNTGLTLLKLGINAQLMGKVGDDLFGQAIRQIIGRYGSRAAEGMVVDTSVSSSYTVIISPPGVDRIFWHCPSANDNFDASDVRYDVLKTARLFHFGYPPLMKQMYLNDGCQLTEIYRRAKQTGVTTSLDTALPDPSSQAGQADWRTILENTLPFVDIFLPSIEEILFMLRPALYHQMCREESRTTIPLRVTPKLLSDLSGEMLDLGVKIAVIKLGERGLYLRTAGQQAIAGMGNACPATPEDWAGRELWTPCFAVDVVGTTGAGDATIAGFLAALLRDKSPRQALTFAVAVGACNVEAPDALGCIRTWDETMIRINSGWRKQALTLAEPGWQFDQADQIWENQAGGK